MSEKKVTKRQREDQALNRVLIWFGAAVALELFMLLINRFYVGGSGGGSVRVLGIVLTVLAVGGLLGGVAAGFWLVKVKGQKGPLVAPVATMVICLVLAACCAITLRWQGDGVRLLYVLLPVAAVLGLIYYLYQREFFLVALVAGGGLLSVWTLWKSSGFFTPVTWVVVVVSVLVAAAGAAFAALLHKNDGQLTIKGKRVRVLPKKASYLCVYLTAALSVVSILCGCFLGAGVAYGLIFLMVGWLFIMAVYHTVRLM